MTDEAPPLQGRRRTLAILSVLSAMALAVLDASVVNVALPSIADALHVGPARAIWVVTVYQTALLMALLPFASLGERWGYRKVFVAGVALFIGASALCTLATTLPWLIAARFLQGLGAAAIMALGVALLRLSIGTGQLAAAIGWNALTVALCTAAGPSLGALLLSAADWPMLFAINLPIGGLVLFAANALPRSAGTGQPIDLRSMILSASIFAAFVIAAEMTAVQPVVAAGVAVLALIGLAALVRREMPRPSPLVPLDLLRDRAFRVAVTASVLCFMGQAVSIVALPFYLQHGLGQSRLATGLYMTAWPVTVALVTPITRRLADHLPTALLCAVGGVCLAFGTAGCALWPARDDPRPLIGFVAMCGLGFGLFQVPNNRTMFLAVPLARSGAAGGMQGTARLTGQTAGAVAMTLIFVFAEADMAPRVGLAFGAVLTATAGLVSLKRSGAGDMLQRG